MHSLMNAKDMFLRWSEVPENASEVKNSPFSLPKYRDVMLQVNSGPYSSPLSDKIMARLIGRCRWRLLMEFKKNIL